MSSFNSKEFTHNDLSRQDYQNNTNSYTVKVNSRDRNIQNDKNPFDFKIKFNKTNTKYTNYYLNDWWKTSDTNVLSKTIQVNNGAIIEDAIENVKDFRLSEIVAPRFVPTDKIGKYVENITVVCNDNSSKRVFFKTSDETKVSYISDSVSFIRLTDFNQNTYNLFKSSDVDSLSLDFKKTYGLLTGFFTCLLSINDKLYKISDIGDSYLVLDSVPDFIESKIYLPEYYSNLVWLDTDSLSNSKISYSMTSLAIEECGHIINHNFTKGSILDLNDSFFKIESLQYTFKFKDINGNIVRTEVKNYPDIVFSETDKASIISGLNNTPEVLVSVEFTGSWVHGSYPPTINDGSTNKIMHLREGLKDLLNEKLFYLSLDPITPSKNLITNGKLNNVLGAVYPSTQSRNYIYLSGKYVGEHFNYRNLQNLRDISFKLYYKDGTIVGNNLQNYTLDYLEKDCRQVLVSFNVDQVDRAF